ncbi:MAG: hypothetical protein AVDCRST_MAG28-50 [uncultured Rubrobacteraceae bacterium]|uniref:Uncharacterized protein n=1 Tax=uncultured Rubrobacteraceae bacterium TaxID=349277 RepID=A0A6J4QA53_9ACTN|nr:MAG: hypothetical protein AVDCRST_MAG28-50 [uncultured Rubrobacteraceae bacterium]
MRRDRRPGRDYERKVQTSETLIKVVMSVSLVRQVCSLQNRL